MCLVAIAVAVVSAKEREREAEILLFLCAVFGAEKREASKTMRATISVCGERRRCKLCALLSLSLSGPTKKLATRI